MAVLNRTLLPGLFLIVSGLLVLPFTFFVSGWGVGLLSGSLVGAGLGSLAHQSLRLLKRKWHEKTQTARLRALPDTALAALALLLEERNRYAYSSADGDEESFDALVKAGLAYRFDKAGPEPYYQFNGRLDRNKLQVKIDLELARRLYNLGEPGPRLGPRSRRSGLAS